MAWRANAAGATTTVTYEGRTRPAYAFDAALRVATLRRSAPPNAANEFSRTQTNRVKFKMTAVALSLIHI